MQTGIYRMDKQQGPTIEHRELYSITYDKTIMEKNMKRNTYTCITESIGYTAEVNTTS